MSLSRPLNVRQYQTRYDGNRPKALVFRGGGTKGVVYAGAMKRFEEEGLLDDVKFFAGTSAGSEFAAMLAFGYRGEELRERTRTMPWKKLLDFGDGCCAPIQTIYRLFWHSGLCKGDALEQYLDKQFTEASGIPGCTFKQLYEQKGVELRLGACDVVERKFVFLDRKNTPNMPISKACRASSSIPIVFKPLEYDGKVYVDGGLEGALPISAFTDLEENPKILAFNLLSDHDCEPPSCACRPKPREAPKGLLSLLQTQAEMMKEAANAVHGVDSLSTLGRDLAIQGVDIVNINTGKHGFMETSMDEEDLKDLMERGYKAVNEYLVPPEELSPIVHHAMEIIERVPSFFGDMIQRVHSPVREDETAAAEVVTREFVITAARSDEQEDEASQRMRMRRKLRGLNPLRWLAL
mmetsp:Transcript_58318/g.109942  ORF Transcript_58318/g.109942 Transcript_58318/m.109942 type:complete len:408 (-) Transcript_58318:83-1306(-)